MKTTIINSFHKSLCLIGALLAISLMPPLVMAETVTSKVESLGEMTYLKVTDLRTTQRNGLLNVQVEVSNDNSSNEQLFYRFKWLPAATDFRIQLQSPNNTTSGSSNSGGDQN